MSCCEANARGSHCDCSLCGRCETDKLRPQPTAYERDQQALRDRMAALESRVDGNAGAAVMLIESQRDRLAAALRRIEQLEREVARLKAWSRPPAEMCLKCGTGFTTPEHVESHRCSP